MLAKLIVGIAGLLVLGAGGFLYYESLDQSDSNKRSCCQSQSPSTCPASSVQPICSMDQSQTRCCTKEESEMTQTSSDKMETLAVMPRMVEE